MKPRRGYAVSEVDPTIYLYVVTMYVVWGPVSVRVGNCGCVLRVVDVKCAEGSVLEAVVLYVDLTAECLEISLNSGLRSQVKNHTDSKYTKVRLVNIAM